MKKKFFLISQVFYPDEVSTANLFTNLCTVIEEEQYEVEVWCAQPSYSVLKRQPKMLVYKGVNIYYLASTNFPKAKMIGRIANFLTFSISVSLKLLFSKEKHTVFTHTTPPPLGIIISFICSLKKRKFVYILLDIFPEGLIRLGKVSKKNLLIIFWSYMFLAALKKCWKIIVIGRDMQEWLEKIYPESVKKVKYIPHWQDDEIEFSSVFYKNEYIIKYELTDKFVIQYSGNMGLWNDMELFGNAVQRNIEDVVFMFVGGGIRMNEFLRSFSYSSQKNVLFLPFQPIEKLGSILTACHIGLVSLRDGLEGMAVPCKIYGIMAAGVPVIALVPPNSEIAYIVKEENCGFVLNPTDLEGLLNAICLLKSDETLRKQMGYNSRMAFEKKYTTRKIAGKYMTILNEL